MIVSWTDNDTAGRRGARILRDSLDHTFRVPWRTHRWRRLLVDQDASDMHQNYTLASFLARRPWELLPPDLDPELDHTQESTNHPRREP